MSTQLSPGASNWLHTQSLVANAKRKEVGLTGNYEKTQQAIDAEYVSENTIGGPLGDAIQGAQMDIVEERGLFNEEPTTDTAPVEETLPFEQPDQSTVSQGTASDIDSQIGRLNESLNNQVPVTQPTFEDPDSDLPPPPEPVAEVRTSTSDYANPFRNEPIHSEQDRITQLAAQNLDEQRLKQARNESFEFEGEDLDIMTPEGMLQNRIKNGQIHDLEKPDQEMTMTKVNGQWKIGTQEPQEPTHLGKLLFNDYARGDRALIDGEWKFWTGKNHGWQSYESALKLEEKGKLRWGTQEMDNFLAQYGIDPLERRKAEERLKEFGRLNNPIEQLNEQDLFQFLDIDPRVATALMLGARVPSHLLYKTFIKGKSGFWKLSDKNPGQFRFWDEKTARRATQGWPRLVEAQEKWRKLSIGQQRDIITRAQNKENWQILRNRLTGYEWNKLTKNPEILRKLLNGEKVPGFKSGNWMKNVNDWFMRDIGPYLGKMGL